MAIPRKKCPKCKKGTANCLSQTVPDPEFKGEWCIKLQWIYMNCDWKSKPKYERI